jgi:hypothetical protein
MSRSRRLNRLIDLTDFDSELLLPLRTLSYDITNLRRPGWYGQLTLDNVSTSNDLSVYIEAVTSNETTGQDDVVALLGSATNPSRAVSGGNTLLEVLERNRLTSSVVTVIRITYEFANDYLPFIVIPPTINLINDLPGVLDITFSNGQNGLNSTIEFTADAPSGWYGESRFYNDSFTNAMTLSAEARDTLPTGRVVVTSLFGPRRILGGNNTAFELPILNRLNNIFTEIALIYQFDNPNAETLTPSVGPITNVNNIPGQEVTIIFSSVSDFEYIFVAEPTRSGYYGIFTFRNASSFQLNLRVDAIVTVNGQEISRLLLDAVLAANNGADSFERFVSTRLPDVNTVIRLTYSFVNPDPTTVEVLQILEQGLTRSNVILGQRTDLTVGSAYLDGTGFLYTISAI